MISDEVLLTWLTAFRLDCGSDAQEEFHMPTAIRQELMERGWLERIAGGTPNSFRFHVTNKGCAASDLFAPECGVNPLGRTVC